MLSFVQALGENALEANVIHRNALLSTRAVFGLLDPQSRHAETHIDTKNKINGQVGRSTADTDHRGLSLRHSADRCIFAVHMHVRRYKTLCTHRQCMYLGGCIRMYMYNITYIYMCAHICIYVHIEHIHTFRHAILHVCTLLFLQT